MPGLTLEEIEKLEQQEQVKPAVKAAPSKQSSLKPLSLEEIESLELGKPSKSASLEELQKLGQGEEGLVGFEAVKQSAQSLAPRQQTTEAGELVGRAISSGIGGPGLEAAGKQIKGLVQGEVPQDFASDLQSKVAETKQDIQRNRQESPEIQIGPFKPNAFDAVETVSGMGAGLMVPQMEFIKGASTAGKLVGEGLEAGLHGTVAGGTPETALLGVAPQLPRVGAKAAAELGSKVITGIGKIPQNVRGAADLEKFSTRPDEFRKATQTGVEELTLDKAVEKSQQDFAQKATDALKAKRDEASKMYDMAFEKQPMELLTSKNVDESTAMKHARELFKFADGLGEFGKSLKENISAVRLRVGPDGKVNQVNDLKATVGMRQALDSVIDEISPYGQEVSLSLNDKAILNNLKKLRNDVDESIKRSTGLFEPSTQAALNKADEMYSNWAKSKDTIQSELGRTIKGASGQTTKNLETQRVGRIAEADPKRLANFETSIQNLDPELSKQFQPVKDILQKESDINLAKTELADIKKKTLPIVGKVADPESLIRASLGARQVGQAVGSMGVSPEISKAIQASMIPITRERVQNNRKAAEEVTDTFNNPGLSTTVELITRGNTTLSDKQIESLARQHNVDRDILKDILLKHKLTK